MYPCFKPTLIITVPNSPSTIKVSPKVQLSNPQSVREELGTLLNTLWFRLLRANRTEPSRVGSVRFGWLVSTSCAWKLRAPTRTRRVPGPGSRVEAAPAEAARHVSGHVAGKFRSLVTVFGTSAALGSLPTRGGRRTNPKTQNPETLKPKTLNLAGTKGPAESPEGRRLRLRGERGTHRAGIGTLPGSTHALSPASAASWVRVVRLPVPLFPAELGHVSPPPCRGYFGAETLLSGAASCPLPSGQRSPRNAAKTHARARSIHLPVILNPQLWPCGASGSNPPPPSCVTGFPLFPLSCVTRNVPSSQNRVGQHPAPPRPPGLEETPWINVYSY